MEKLDGAGEKRKRIIPKATKERSSDSIIEEKDHNYAESKDYNDLQKRKAKGIKEPIEKIANYIYYQNLGKPKDYRFQAKTEVNKTIDIDNEKQEFLKRISNYREKEKSHIEEKIKLENLLQKLNEGLKLSQQKDEEDYLALLEKIHKTTETEDKQEILVLNGPKQITIEEITDENVSAQEMKEIQSEFPNQNIEEVIESQVVEQINDKTIIPAEKRMYDTPLKRASRKIKVALLAIFISATTFESSTTTKTSESDEVFSYNNIKIENLKDWENVNLHEDEINKLENISIITKSHENSNDKFIIIDKQNGKAHQFQGDSLIKSYNVCLGKDTVGDEQTVLKSIYRQKFEDSDYHRRPAVSLDEATYLKNGERYIKPGYEAFTDWGEGNMKTGAGIYTISNKGPFLNDFGIFLKNERGLQVATSMHVNSGLKKESSNFRFTNGCIGFSKEDLLDLYKTVSREEKVYILPDNPHNKYQIIDGELRFLSNQQNVNRTIRPYEPKPIILEVEKPNETAKIFLMTISENKEKLMGLYPTVSNDVYNELAKIAYGILGQESSFGTYGKMRGQLGRVKDVGTTIVGLHPSVGPCQVRLENINQKIKDIFNIKNTTDLFDTKKNAIAAMSVLLDNYLYVSYNGKDEQYKELVVLKYNAAKEAKKITKDDKKIDQLGPKAKSYIKKVLNYSKLASVYTTNANANYYNPNWNYAELNH
jgi:hypothetical protein